MRAFFLSAALAVGCGDNPAQPCAPGEQISCGCPDEGSGVQVCNDQGTGFEACQCGAGANGPGGSGPGGAGPGGNGPGGAGPGGGGQSAGGAGGGPCAPAAVEDCYEGPAGTADVGTCLTGTRICAVNGTWGDCMGQVLPSSEDCQTSDDEDCDGATPPCSAQWSVAFGPGSTLFDLEVSSAGDVFAIGQFEGTVSFGGSNTHTSIGTADLYVVKLDAAGQHVYSHALKDPIDWIEPSRLATDDAGNLYVSFAFFGTQTLLGQTLTAEGFEGERDLGLAKIAPDGAVQWVVSYGSTKFDYAYDVEVDEDGNVLLAVGHSGPIYFGGAEVLDDFLNQHAIALVKLDPDGNHIYSFDAFVSAGYGTSLAVEPGTNDVVLMGPFAGSVDLGTGPITSASGNLFVARFDDAGAALYCRNYGGATANVSPASLIASPGGDVTVAGSFNGPQLDLGDGTPIVNTGANMFLVRFDAAGDVVHANPYFLTSGSGLFPNGLVRSSADGATLVGGLGGTVDLGGGAFTDGAFKLTLGATGGFVAEEHYNFLPTSFVAFVDVDLAPDGVAIVGGTYSGPDVAFGATTLPDPMGNSSAMVLRLLP